MKPSQKKFIGKSIKRTKSIGELLLQKSQKKLSLPQLVLLNSLASTLVFSHIYKKLATWPMLDIISYMDKFQGNGVSYTSSDLFINSQLDESGRGPFVFLSYIVTTVTQITPEKYLALGSAILIAFGPIVVLIALIQTRKDVLPNKKAFTILDAIVLATMQYFLAHYGPRLALAGYSSYRFTQGLVAETLSIFLTATAIIGFINTEKRLVRLSNSVILFAAILLHPPASVLFLVLWIILKFAHKNYRNIAFPMIPLLLALFVEIFIIRNHKNTLTGFQFTQIYANLRHPHHLWPSYFISKIFLTYFLIAILILILLRILLRIGTAFRGPALLTTYVLVILVVQYLLVEKESLLLVSQFSITRGFVYIGFCFCVFFYWVYEDIFLKIAKSKEIYLPEVRQTGKPIARIFTVVLAIFLFLNTYDISSNVESEFVSLQERVQSELNGLGIMKGDMVILDLHAVDSSGWREYGYVNIWLDSYFPFDMVSIAEYRNRWLQFCGKERMESCMFLTNSMTNSEFDLFMMNNHITVLVRGKADSKFSSHGWLSTGTFGPYEAFRKY